MTARVQAPPTAAGTAEANGVALSWSSYGNDGPWIVLIHGVLVATPTWQGQLPAGRGTSHLSGGRLLAYDQRGYGGSSMGDRRDMVTYADDLLALLDALDIERTVLVGFSMGGFVALEAAAKAPERMIGLVLPGCGVPADPMREAYLERAAQLEGPDALSHVRDHVGRAFSPEYVEAHPEQIESYAEHALTADPAALAETFRSISAWRPSDAVRAIDLPMLLISGEQDGLLGPERAAELRQSFPGAGHEILPGAGHTAHYEQAEPFNRMVSEFVGRVAGEG